MTPVGQGGDSSLLVARVPLFVAMPSSRRTREKKSNGDRSFYNYIFPSLSLLHMLSIELRPMLIFPFLIFMNIDEAELSLRLYSTSSWTGALNTPHTLLLLLPSVCVTLSYYFHIAYMDRLVTYSRRRSYARLDILMDAFLLFMVLRFATSRLYHYHPRFFRWFGNTHLGRSPGNFMVLLILNPVAR